MAVYVPISNSYTLQSTISSIIFKTTTIFMTTSIITFITLCISSSTSCSFHPLHLHDQLNTFIIYNA